MSYFFTGPFRVVNDRVDFVCACEYANYFGTKKMLLLVDRDTLLDVNGFIQRGTRITSEPLYEL